MFHRLPPVNERHPSSLPLRQVPPCVRLSLETLHGSVGVDLFHVKVPGAPGEEMHLLALKEDGWRRLEGN